MTEEDLKRARWVDRSISLGLVVVGILGTSWASGITTFKERLDKKVDKEYVSERIKLHEEKEKEIFEPMQKDLSDIKNYLFYNKLPDK